MRTPILIFNRTDSRLLNNKRARTEQAQNPAELPESAQRANLQLSMKTEAQSFTNYFFPSRCFVGFCRVFNTSLALLSIDGI